MHGRKLELKDDTTIRERALDWDITGDYSPRSPRLVGKEGTHKACVKYDVDLPNKPTIIIIAPIQNIH